MNSYYIADPSVDALAAFLAALKSQTPLTTVLILAADQNGWTADQLKPLLTAEDMTLIGGIFPQVIYEGQNYTQGTVIVCFTEPMQWALIEGLSDLSGDFDTPLLELADTWDTLPGEATHLVLVDGLATCIATFIEALFMNFGLEKNYLGGGAGSLSFVQQPCLITPQGLVKDAALLVRMPYHSGIGVSHGWTAISEPMKVTAADKNLVMSLDWKPAFEVYRSLVEQHSGQVFTEDNFFDIAKSYPLGISKLDAELIVRDPLMLKDDTAIVCVGEVPEGSFVRILTGTPDSLIGAAADANRKASQAYQAVSSAPPQLAILIDCISRVLFMQERILDEFQQVSGDYPLVGALTLGEIANTGKDYLEFYNKTAVLGLLSSVTE